jgi:hypothetical protein
MTELIAEQRFAEAEREAARYLSLAGASGRAHEVRLIRGNLLREHLGAPAKAAALYRQVADGDAPAALKSEAWFDLGLADEAEGQGDEAKAAFWRAKEILPNGPHRAEIDQRLR